VLQAAYVESHNIHIPIHDTASREKSHFHHSKAEVTMTVSHWRLLA